MILPSAHHLSDVFLYWWTGATILFVLDSNKDRLSFSGGEGEKISDVE